MVYKKLKEFMKSAKKLTVIGQNLCFLLSVSAVFFSMNLTKGKGFSPNLHNLLGMNNASSTCSRH